MSNVIPAFGWMRSDLSWFPVVGPVLPTLILLLEVLLLVIVFAMLDSSLQAGGIVCARLDFSHSMAPVCSVQQEHIVRNPVVLSVFPAHLDLPRNLRALSVFAMLVIVVTMIAVISAPAASSMAYQDRACVFRVRTTHLTAQREVFHPYNAVQMFSTPGTVLLKIQVLPGVVIPLEIQDFAMPPSPTSN